MANIKGVEIKLRPKGSLTVWYCEHCEHPFRQSVSLNAVLTHFLITCPGRTETEDTDGPA